MTIPCSFSRLSIFHLSLSLVPHQHEVVRMSSLVHAVIVFLGKINNLDQTAPELFENLAFGCFRIEIVLLTVVGLCNHTLYCRLDDIRCNEIALFLGEHNVLRIDTVIVALIIRSLGQ